MAYARASGRIAPGEAAKTILEARKRFGFDLKTVQCDNGSEYSRYFEQQMHLAGIQTRHSRLHRPNDNAHIERFNRTIQTECIGHYWRRNIPLSRQQAKLASYLDYYNNHRVRLGVQLRTPREMLQRF